MSRTSSPSRRKTDLALKAPVRQNLPNRVRASGPWRSYPGKPDNPHPSPNAHTLPAHRFLVEGVFDMRDSLRKHGSDL
jgi:hypothetical protein